MAEMDCVAVDRQKDHIQQLQDLHNDTKLEVVGSNKGLFLHQNNFRTKTVGGQSTSMDGSETFKVDELFGSESSEHSSRVNLSDKESGEESPLGAQAADGRGFHASSTTHQIYNKFSSSHTKAKSRKGHKESQSPSASSPFMDEKQLRSISPHGINYLKSSVEMPSNVDGSVRSGKSQLAPLVPPGRPGQHHQFMRRRMENQHQINTLGHSQQSSLGRKAAGEGMRQRSKNTRGNRQQETLAQIYGTTADTN